MWNFIFNNIFFYLIFIFIILFIISFYTLWERKLLAGIQRRHGPIFSGIFGILQPFADGLKLLLKQIKVPQRVYKNIFFASSWLALILSLIVWVVIPFNSQAIIADINLGIVLIFAISSLNVHTTLFSGWSSNNRYALMGGVRSGAQVISYELPMSLSVLVILLFSNTFNIINLVNFQIQNFWFIILFPIPIIFFITLLAESNRTPFDLPEAESELVAGYNIEYSAIIFAFFFLAEYNHMIILSILFSILFWGGWSLNPFNFVFIMIWTKIEFFNYFILKWIYLKLNIFNLCFFYFIENLHYNYLFSLYIINYFKVFIVFFFVIITFFIYKFGSKNIMFFSQKMIIFFMLAIIIWVFFYNLSTISEFIKEFCFINKNGCYIGIEEKIYDIYVYFFVIKNSWFSILKLESHIFIIVCMKFWYCLTYGLIQNCQIFYFESFILFIKTLILMCFVIFIRSVLPRFTFFEVISLCWVSLLPYIFNSFLFLCLFKIFWHYPVIFFFLLPWTLWQNFGSDENLYSINILLKNMNIQLKSIKINIYNYIIKSSSLNFFFIFLAIEPTKQTPSFLSSVVTTFALFISGYYAYKVIKSFFTSSKPPKKKSTGEDSSGDSEHSSSASATDPSPQITKTSEVHSQTINSQSDSITYFREPTNSSFSNETSFIDSSHNMITSSSSNFSSSSSTTIANFDPGIINSSSSYVSSSSSSSSSSMFVNNSSGVTETITSDLGLADKYAYLVSEPVASQDLEPLITFYYTHLELQIYAGLYKEVAEICKEITGPLKEAVFMKLCNEISRETLTFFFSQLNESDLLILRPLLAKYGIIL